MEMWSVAVLGGGDTGKTSLVVQVCWLSRLSLSLTFGFYSLLQIVSLVSKLASPYSKYTESPSTRLE